MSTDAPDYTKIIDEIKQEKRKLGMTRSKMVQQYYADQFKGGRGVRSVEAKMRCPVCGGPVIFDQVLSEYVCTNCGIVLDKNTFPVSDGKAPPSLKVS